MEELQHDPRTKQQIKDLLYSFLYTPVQQQFKQRLDTLITRNTVILGVTHKSFIYKGTVYTCDNERMPRRMNRLAIQLIPDMDDYLADLKQLNDHELPYVLGFITQVLNASNDLHDYLRLLPQSVHSPIEKLIATYPCQAKHLTEDAIQGIQARNHQSIALMKNRMVTNLLI